jgi:hypothetical protein
VRRSLLVRPKLALRTLANLVSPGRNLSTISIVLKGDPQRHRGPRHTPVSEESPSFRRNRRRER